MAKHHHDGHHGHHHKTGGPIEAEGHEHGMKRGGHAGHHGHHHKRRAHGGRAHEFVSGNPDVMEEAHDKHGTAKKHGGRAHHGKKHHHGKHHKATGGGVALGLMTGGGVAARADKPKPGRKKGGRVGADHSPLSSAHHGHGDGHETPKSNDTYGGTPA